MPDKKCETLVFLSTEGVDSQGEVRHLSKHYRCQGRGNHAKTGRKRGPFIGGYSGDSGRHHHF